MIEHLSTNSNADISYDLESSLRYRRHLMQKGGQLITHILLQTSSPCFGFCSQAPVTLAATNWIDILELLGLYCDE